MNRDFSGEEHRENSPGSTSISGGRNVLGPEGSHTDCGSRIAPPEDNESGHDSIMEVKVESEFIDDSFSLVKDGAHRGKSETLQRNFLQTSQDILKKHPRILAKQEPCDSPSQESSEVAQLLEDFIVEVKVEPDFVDYYSSLIQGDADLVKSETFQSNFLQTSHDSLSNEGVKQELCDSPTTELSKPAQQLKGVLKMARSSMPGRSSLEWPKGLPRLLLRWPKTGPAVQPLEAPCSAGEG